MPEMTFSVRWPDGQTGDFYSPSLVMHDHLAVGATYTVSEFLTRSVHALDLASQRVQQRFGFACTSAAATQSQLKRTATTYAGSELVEVVRMHPPLPRTEEPA